VAPGQEGGTKDGKVDHGWFGEANAAASPRSIFVHGRPRKRNGRAKRVVRVPGMGREGFQCFKIAEP